MKYTGWVLQLHCTNDRAIINMLQVLAKEMDDELYQWENIVKHQREKFYELNYYTTLQLLTLRKEFGRVNASNQAVVSPEVLALLQSISTQVTHKEVSDALCQVRTAVKPEIVSDSLERETVNATEVVNQDVPSFATEDAGVHLSVPQAESDAPTLTAESDTHKPGPTLTEDKLTEKQKAIMANIVTRLNYSKKLILMAFEQCPPDSDAIDYTRWCVDNENEYDYLNDYSDDEEDSDSDSDGESSLISDSESRRQDFKYHSHGN